MNQRRLWIFLVLICSLIPSAYAVQTLEPQNTSVDGQSFAVNSYSNGSYDYALMSAGGSFRRYNLSNATLTTQIWGSAQYDEIIFRQIIRDIVVNGSTAYVIQNGQLSIVDLSSWTILSNLSSGVTLFDSSYMTHGALKNTTLYVTTYGANVKIIDVSNPAAPSIINTIIAPSGHLNRTWGINVTDTRLLIGAMDTKPVKVDIYDISDYSKEISPTYITTWSAPSNASSRTYESVSDIQAMNNTIIVLNAYYCGWHIIDITGDTPTLLSSASGVYNALPTYEAVSLRKINSTEIAVSLRYNTYALLDITNPSSPVIDYVDISVSKKSLGYTEGISFLNNTLLVNALTYGMYLFNVANVHSPYEYNTSNTGHVPITAEPFAFYYDTANNLIYQASRNNIFAIYDEFLRLIDTNITSGTRFYGIHPLGDKIYATAANYGLLIDNASTPNVINVTLDIDPDHYSDFVIVDNKYLYSAVGAQQAGVYIDHTFVLGVTDISLSNPSLVTTMEFTETGQPDMTLFDSFVLYNNTTLLVTGHNSQGGFLYIDITNRTNPTIIKRNQYSSGYGRILFNNTSFIISGWNSTSAKFEIANISNMGYTLIDSVSRSGINSIKSLCQIGNNVYGGGSSYFDQYNISNTSNIELVGTFAWYAPAPDAAIVCSSDTIYGGDTWGLYEFADTNIPLTGTGSPDVPPPSGGGGGGVPPAPSGAWNAHKDNYMYKVNTSQNNGGSTQLQIRGATATELRSILGFNLSLADLVGTTQNLTVFYTQWVAPNPAGKNLSICRVHENRSMWEENGSTWLNYSNGTAWTTAGGDYYSPCLNFTMPDYSTDTTPNVRLSFNVSALVSLNTSDSANMSFILMQQNHSDSGVIYFESLQNANTSRLPYMLLTSLNDTTPPDPITALTNITYEQTYITWTWIDPIDLDFDHVNVYLDNVAQSSVAVGVQTFNAIGLNPGTSYTISTQTVDASGNVNPIWVNHTATTANTPSYIVSGYVNDSTGSFINAVSVVNGTNSTTTNATGYYSISMSNGTYNFTFSKAGYDTGYKAITINGAAISNQNMTLNASASPSSPAATSTYDPVAVDTFASVGKLLLVVIIVAVLAIMLTTLNGIQEGKTLDPFILGMAIIVILIVLIVYQLISMIGASIAQI